MLCAANLSAGAQVEAHAGAASAQTGAARFSQLVNAPCQDPASADRYVDGPSGAEVFAKDYPILDVLSQIRGLDLPHADHARAGKAGHPPETSAEPEEGQSESSHFEDAAAQVVAAQDEILRTVLMFETLSSTRQGVQTLFQLQG
jgi:hypothetical protein